MKKIVTLAIGALVLNSVALPNDARAAETFVLVFSGGPKPDPSKIRTLATGQCLIVLGSGASTKTVNSHVPGSVTISADLISCSFQSIQSGVGTVTVTLRKGSASGEIVAQSSVTLANDIATVAGH